MSTSRLRTLRRGAAAALLVATALVAVPGSPAAAAFVPNFSARTPAVALNNTGTLELFATDGSDRVWRRAQTSPGAQTWTPWSGFGDSAAMRSLAAQANGTGISLFGVDPSGLVSHRWQTPNGWTAWQGIPDMSARSIAVARSGDGRLHLFAVHRMAALLYHAVQAAPGTNQWSSWTQLDGNASAVVAEANADGGVDLFMLDGGGGASWRTQGATGWTPWAALGGNFTALAAARNKDGRLEVFGATSTGQQLHRWQIQPGSTSWAPWSALSGRLRSVAAEANADGRLELLGATNLGQFFHRRQQPGGWSELAPLDGALSPPSRPGGVHSVVDGGGQTGAYPAIAIGVDGLAVIAYRNESTGVLKLARCNNPECTSALTTTIDSTGDTGYYASIAIGGDGLPVIAYVTRTGANLRLAHCLNLVCTQRTIVTLDEASYVNSAPGLAIGVDGLPVIGYSHWVSGHRDPVYVIKCHDHGCTSMNWNQVYSGEFIASAVSIEIAADGNPTFVVDEGFLRVGHCGSRDCGTVTGVADVFVSGGRVATAVGTDGKMLLALNSPSLPGGETADMFVTHCANTACSTFDTGSLVDTGGYHGAWPSLRAGDDGLGVVSYFEYYSGVLRVGHCNDVGCTSATNTGVRVVATGAFFTALAIGLDGMPLIAYQNPLTADLEVVHCNNPACTGF